MTNASITATILSTGSGGDSVSDQESGGKERKLATSVLKHKTFILTVLTSSFQRCFYIMYYKSEWESKSTFLSKTLKHFNICKNIKKFFFLIWSIVVLKTEIFYDSFFFFLKFYWTLNFEDYTMKCWDFLNFCRSNVQSSIKWWERIVQQVSRGRCELETLISNVMDLVTNKNFSIS